MVDALNWARRRLWRRKGIRRVFCRERLTTLYLPFSEDAARNSGIPFLVSVSRTLLLASHLRSACWTLGFFNIAFISSNRALPFWWRRIFCGCCHGCQFRFSGQMRRVALLKKPHDALLFCRVRGHCLGGAGRIWRSGILHSSGGWGGRYAFGRDGTAEAADGLPARDERKEKQHERVWCLSSRARHSL